MQTKYLARLWASKFSTRILISLRRNIEHQRCLSRIHLSSSNWRCILIDIAHVAQRAESEVPREYWRFAAFTSSSNPSHARLSHIPTVRRIRIDLLPSAITPTLIKPGGSSHPRMLIWTDHSWIVLRVWGSILLLSTSRGRRTCTIWVDSHLMILGKLLIHIIAKNWGSSLARQHVLFLARVIHAVQILELLLVELAKAALPSLIVVFLVDYLT